MTTHNKNDLLKLTSDIVCSYVESKSVSLEELETVMERVHNKVMDLDKQATGAGGRQPKVSIKESVQPDYLICLEDGKKLKMLKRYLKTNYNMTPQEYRERWNLPPDYPMVAPNYSKKRSQLAKKIGLGSNSNSGNSQAA